MAWGHNTGAAYGGARTGEGIADAVRESMADDHMDLDFKTEITLSDAVKNSSTGGYATRAQEELTQDLSNEAIRSSPTAGDAWGAVKNARSFLTKEGGPYAYQTGLKKVRTLGSSATYLSGLSALASIHPALAVLSLVPQGLITEGAAKLGFGPKRTGKNRFFDALRGDYFGTGSTLSRLNSGLWDALLPSYDEDDDYQTLLSTGDWPSIDDMRPDWALRINDQ